LILLDFASFVRSFLCLQRRCFRSALSADPAPLTWLGAINPYDQNGNITAGSETFAINKSRMFATDQAGRILQSRRADHARFVEIAFFYARISA
jgi:hypothetical protein